jgi:hypothetical protein
MGSMRIGMFIASVIAVGAATFFAATVLSSSVGNSPDPTPTVEPTPLPTSTPTPDTTPTEDPLAVAPTCEERATLAEQLMDDIAAAMDGYEGTWGFALYDRHCDHWVNHDPTYTQYSASAGKIVSIIAVLRAVEEGRVQLSEIEASLEAVLTHSWDNEADHLESFTTQPDYDDILSIAGTETTRFNGAWRHANMGPADMAKIWAALLAGDYLSAEHTELILRLAGGSIIPEEYRTFPDGSFDPPDFRYGQKAGYYVSDGVPYFFVGAGFVLHEPTGQDFFPAFMSVSDNEDLFEPQRRQVFPLVMNYILAALGPQE